MHRALPIAAISPSFRGARAIPFRGGGPRLAKVPGQGLTAIAPAGLPHLARELRQHLRCRVAERGPSVVISFHAAIVVDAAGARTFGSPANANANAR